MQWIITVNLQGMGFNYLPIWFFFPIVSIFLLERKNKYDSFNNNKSLLATQIKISTHYVLILFLSHLLSKQHHGNNPNKIWTVGFKCKLKRHTLNKV